MKDLEEFMKEKHIINLKINLESLSKEQVAMYDTLNQIILYLDGTAYYTESFITHFDTVYSMVLPKEWMKWKIEKRVVEITIKIKDYVSTGDGFFKLIAIIVNLLENIISVVKKMKSVFGKHNIVTNYLQLYKTFAEIAVKNLSVLLYNAGGGEHFGEANEFVDKYIMKHYRLNNDPKDLLDAFIELVAILASLSKTAAERGWEILKEEVCKHGGVVEREKPIH